MKYEDQEAQTPAFTGTSTKSMEEAVHNASLEAKRYFDSVGRKGRIYLQILRHEVAIGNPHITEYRVFISETPGAGSG